MSASERRYRVRHPAAPELFVWCAGDCDWRVLSFGIPLERHGGPLGVTAALTVTFAEVREPMTLAEAESLAKFVGGTVEEVGRRRLLKKP